METSRRGRIRIGSTCVDLGIPERDHGARKRCPWHGGRTGDSGQMHWDWTNWMNLNGHTGEEHGGGVDLWQWMNWTRRGKSRGVGGSGLGRHHRQSLRGNTRHRRKMTLKEREQEESEKGDLVRKKTVDERSSNLALWALSILKTC